MERDTSLIRGIYETTLDQLLWLKQQTRTFVRARVPERYRRPVLGGAAGNAEVARYIETGAAAAAGKIGAYELKGIRRWSTGERWSSRERRLLNVNAGIFPPETAVFERWAVYFSSILSQMDVLAAWNNPGEAHILDQYAPQAVLVKSLALEPYYHSEPWSAKLRGRRVLVVSPFAVSVERQYAKRNLIWPGNPEVLPELELRTLKCPLSDALVKSPFPDWFTALDWLVSEVRKSEADVVLIGAGAFSLPLAVEAKRFGKIGIHTGGWTQILFGIKGAVWDKNPLISRFYNESWTRPLPEERPQHFKRVERGRYW
jgi:hypothetical protein